MDNNLEYSKEALEVNSLFFNKEISVYVEGDDDELFWGYLFDFAKITNVSIRNVGGKEEINRYIERITSEDIDIIVCADSDYSEILKLNKLDQRIIYTFGYSIENIMYCPKTINNIVKKYSKKSINVEDEVLDWYDNLFDNISELLYYDIANEKFLKSTKVLGDNAAHLLTSNDSHKLSEVKINKLIENMNKIFTVKEIEDIKDYFKDYKNKDYKIIRGHFLTLPVINLVKKLVRTNSNKKISISLDNLFSLTSDACVNCRNKCKLKDEILSKIKDAYLYFGKN